MTSLNPNEYRLDTEQGFVYGRLGVPIKRSVNGYVCLLRHGKSYLVHRLLWESVHGPIPDGMHINHINGNKSDNRLANLELVTPSGNTKHAYAIGLSCAKGENNGRAKLTWADVDNIRSFPAPAWLLAKVYDVSQTTIRQARNGDRWSNRPKNIGGAA